MLHYVTKLIIKICHEVVLRRQCSSNLPRLYYSMGRQQLIYVSDCLRITFSNLLVRTMCTKSGATVVGTSLAWLLGLPVRKLERRILCHAIVRSVKRISSTPACKMEQLTH